MTSYHELKGYIDYVQSEMHQSSFVLSSKSAVYGFLQIIFYLFFVGMLFFAIAIPSNPLEFSQTLNNGDQVSGSYQIDELKSFMMLVKGLVVFFSLGFFAAAVLCGKVRRRSAKLRKTLEVIDRVHNLLKVEVK